MRKKRGRDRERQNKKMTDKKGLRLRPGPSVSTFLSDNKAAVKPRETRALPSPGTALFIQTETDRVKRDTDGENKR